MAHYSNPNKYSDLVVSAVKLHGPDSFIIEIEADKVDNLLGQFSGDLVMLTSHLKLMNKRMVLLNPKYSVPANAEQREEA